MMRRDRFLLAAALSALFSADFYFILLPKLQNRRRAAGNICSCSPNSNLSLPRLEALATPQLSNWTLTPLPSDASALELDDRGSKLQRLFSHPLYNIQTLELKPEERLLQVEQLIEYYRRKVSHWERSGSKLTLSKLILGIKLFLHLFGRKVRNLSFRVHVSRHAVVEKQGQGQSGQTPLRRFATHKQETHADFQTCYSDNMCLLVNKEFNSVQAYFNLLEA
ncbi:hypothetical protein ILYODFUR_024693 [Ilyodon furcidens]|uniref:Uncharacterized protein n=1 Tax=Ilyodon furcidens TaxID=33524 RepID=A0ABV0SQB6_9TELE